MNQDVNTVDKYESKKTTEVERTIVIAAADELQKTTEMERRTIQRRALGAAMDPQMERQKCCAKHTLETKAHHV